MVGMSKLILIGAGGHAESCIEIIEQTKQYEIIGLIGLENEVGSLLLGYPVLGTDSELGRIVQSCPNALIALGQIHSPALRMAMYKLAVNVGFKFPAIISPNACISRHAFIGNGSVIMNGVIVNAGVKIGENSIINTQAILEHGVQVGDHVHISTGAIVNGNCSIGSESFVGSGVVMRQDITIGKNSFVEMGTFVTKNIVGSI